MESPAATDWAEVRVVSVTPLRRSGLLWLLGVIGHLVRMRFVGSCPYEFFKTATHGNQLDMFEDAGPDEADAFVWR